MIATAAAVYARVKYTAHRRPGNRPGQICPHANSHEPIVVLAGDSITQGTMSADYTQ